MLRKYGINILTFLDERGIDELRYTAVVNRIANVLCREVRNSPLLISASPNECLDIIDELAHGIQTKTVPSDLQNRLVLWIDLGLIVHDAHSNPIETFMSRFLNEVSTSNLRILLAVYLIPQIGLTSILHSVTRGDIQVIGIATPEVASQYICVPNNPPCHRFQPFYLDLDISR